jgi:hypothetical protein
MIQNASQKYLSVAIPLVLFSDFEAVAGYQRHSAPPFRKKFVDRFSSAFEISLFQWHRLHLPKTPQQKTKTINPSSTEL